MDKLLEGNDRHAKSNGFSNGHHHPPQNPSRIIREGETLDSPIGGASYRILMLEPVRQGICTPSTRLIISTTPYIRPLSTEGFDVDHHSESSHLKTQLSLDDFDPDAFLCASLSFLQPAENTNGETSPVEYSPLSNGSNTSGSITPRPGDSHSPVVPLADLTDDTELNGHGPDSGIRFSAIRAHGPADREGNDEVCWVGVGGLGRAGIFEGDWVYLSSKGEGRLVKVLAWERLDDHDSELPLEPILIPPNRYRSLFPHPKIGPAEVTISPTPFGARTPTLPTAKTITLARLATTESVDKRYERSWLKGLRSHFGKTSSEDGRLVRRGDVLAIPIWQDRPMSSEENISDEEEGSDDEMGRGKIPATAIAYFQITSLSFDPLVALEDDFRSSLSSKVRAGELGVWTDVGGDTRMVLTGLERGRISGRQGDLVWRDIGMSFLTLLK